jgi:P-type Cu+ transporter
MEKSTLYGIAIFILIIVAGYFFVIDGNSASAKGNSVAVNNVGNGDAQIITLGMKGGNYYPNTVSVKSGQPVRVSADDSVYGCFRDLTIRDLGVRKYLANVNDYVEFVPQNPGTYTFACSMGMGFGKLIVE